MKRKGGSKNYNLGTYVVGFLFPLEKQHIFWKKKKKDWNRRNIKWVSKHPFVGHALNNQEKGFWYSALRYGSVQAGLWLSRSSGSICSPVPCFPGCRSDPDPGWCHPPPLTSIPLFSMCSGCGEGEQGRGFRSEFCCEVVSWKIHLGTFLTLPLALLAKLWWKNRTEMGTGERMQILAHKEILNYILVDQNTNQLKTTGVHQHAHKSFITIIQGWVQISLKYMNP